MDCVDSQVNQAPQSPQSPQIQEILQQVLGKIKLFTGGMVFERQTTHQAPNPGERQSKLVRIEQELKKNVAQTKDLKKEVAKSARVLTHLGDVMDQVMEQGMKELDLKNPALLFGLCHIILDSGQYPIMLHDTIITIFLIIQSTKKLEGLPPFMRDELASCSAFIIASFDALPFSVSHFMFYFHHILEDAVRVSEQFSH